MTADGQRKLFGKYGRALGRDDDRPMRARSLSEAFEAFMPILRIEEPVPHRKPTRRTRAGTGGSDA